MIITIKRSGGLAGFEAEEVARVDTANISPALTERIKRCIDALAAREPSIGTDMLRYDIEVVEDRGQQRALAVSDDGDPANPLQDLLQMVGEASSR